MKIITPILLVFLIYIAIGTVMTFLSGFGIPMNLETSVSFFLEVFRNPIKLKFSQEEFWKIRLMQISILSKNFERNIITVSNLVKVLKHKPRSIRYYLDNLVRLGYIKKTQEHTFPFDNFYRLTESGINTIEMLKFSYSDTYRNLNLNIRWMEEYMIRQYKWIK